VRRSLLGAAAGLLIPTVSHAEPTRNVELSVFDPAPTTQGSSFQVQNADVGTSGDLVISTWLSYASNPLVLDTVQNPDPVVQHRTMLSLGGAYAFGNSFEAGAHMPFYLQSGMPVPQPMPGQTPSFATTPADGAVLGDLAVHAKARLWRNDNWRFGAGLTVKLPTATDEEFAGTEMPSARATALLSLLATPQLAVNANAGLVVRKKVTFANIEQGSGATWGLGLAYRVAHSLFVDLQAFGDVVPSGRFDAMDRRYTVLTFEGLAGVRYQASRQVGLGLAAGRGLTSDFGTPEVRGVFTLAFTPGARDLAPLPKGPAPAPVDLTKEDTDFDKLNDAVDKCPEQREDKDGFEDDDGCPDTDNDKDGVSDEHDKCIAAAEDVDGFEDTDGCPDHDNDKDGVFDEEDKCPNDAEKINGNADTDGCPDKGESLVISLPERLELLESVLFTGPSVSKASANVIGQLATTLRARVDIVRIRITVHVQPTKFPDRDLALSERRAASVRDWLVARGIAEERIEARGFGGTKTLVAPTQKGAAQINDRIELIILERKY
jgi:outer membrane protein OmpA-like peptidoglycan-associated protein